MWIFTLYNIVVKKNKVCLLAMLVSLSPLFSQQDLTFYSTSKKNFITNEEAYRMIVNADVVYVGEIHDKLACHIAQLYVIKKMDEAKSGKVVVGFEMLDSSFQPVLDEFISGAIDEQTFLEKVNWKKQWGFDYNLYKPIFDYVRERRLKAIALNVPRKIVSKTARSGLNALEEEDKKFLPRKMKVNKNKMYSSYLRETFGAHGDMNKIMTFENYQLSMAVWNESMAENMAKFLWENKGWSAVIVAGNGHIMYNAGIPWSLKRRIKKLKHVSIYTEDLSRKEEYLKTSLPLADIIWFVDFNAK